MRNQPARATFKLAGVKDGAAEVLGENRSVTTTAGEFADSFKPYEVHLYRIR
jgi:hypothetical protein